MRHGGLAASCVTVQCAVVDGGGAERAAGVQDLVDGCNVCDLKVCLRGCVHAAPAVEHCRLRWRSGALEEVWCWLAARPAGFCGHVRWWYLPVRRCPCNTPGDGIAWTPGAVYGLSDELLGRRIRKIDPTNDMYSIVHGDLTLVWSLTCGACLGNAVAGCLGLWIAAAVAAPRLFVVVVVVCVLGAHASGCRD